MDTSQVEDHGVSVELEALQSIYIHELEVSYCPETNVPKVVSINLHPATADNANEQYVRLTLAITLPANYPHELPEISIKSPRGLSDNDLERISKDLNERAQESKGTPMLFELIEIAKEHLTQGNTPNCICTICLYGFSKDDVFTKTDCYHYFHSHCLYRFIEASLSEETGVQPSFKEALPETKVLCPVCRESFNYDLAALKAPPPIQSENAPMFKLDEELAELQQRMSNLFSHQKSIGGIINVEEEKNKFLIEISSVQSNVDIDMHVNRPGLANNVTGAKKKNNKGKKKPRTSDVVKDEKEFDNSSTASVVDVKPIEKSRDKPKQTSTVEQQIVPSNSHMTDSHKVIDAVSQLNERGDHPSNRGGRRRNYKRTNNQNVRAEANCMSSSSQSSFKLNVPRREHLGASSNVKQAAGNNDGERKTTSNENCYAQRERSSADGRRNYYNGVRPRNGNNYNARYRNAQDKQTNSSFSQEERSERSKVGQTSNEKCVHEGGSSCPLKWASVDSQPLVLTGPPNMAFSGAKHSKHSAVKPPPGFEQKNRSGTGFIAMLPPAGFQAPKPPPGFSGPSGSYGDRHLSSPFSLS